MFCTTENFFPKLQHLRQKCSFFGKLRAKLKFPTTIISSVGNMQLSVGKLIATSCLNVFNTRRRWHVKHMPVVLRYTRLVLQLITRGVISGGGWRSMDPQGFMISVFSLYIVPLIKRETAKMSNLCSFCCVTVVFWWDIGHVYLQ